MSVTDPAGFRAAGAAAVLKATGATDVDLVVNDDPAYIAAGVFTAHRCQADRSTEIARDDIVRVVPLNRRSPYVPRRR